MILIGGMRGIVRRGRDTLHFGFHFTWTIVFSAETGRRVTLLRYLHLRPHGRAGTEVRIIDGRKVEVF